MPHRGMPVVDSHVHLLPGRLGEKVRAFFELGGAAGRLAYPNDHARLVEMLADEGVDELWTLPYAHKPGVAAGLNTSSRATVEGLAAAPVRVIGGATAHPGDDDPAEVVRVAVDELGLRVLKLHCSVGDFRLDDVRLDGTLRLAAERRLPVVVHLGHQVSGRTEPDELPALVATAERHPDLVLVLAHAGHHAAREAVALMDRLPNMHVDLTPVVAEHPDLDASHLAAHPERVLFGSDSPNTALLVSDGFAWLEAFGLAPEAMASILGGNARRLIDAVLTEQP